MNLEIVRGGNFSSNCYILYNDSRNKLLIIDLGMTGRLTNFKLKRRISKICNNSRDMEIEVFLTHCHIDHILGSDNLKEYPNVVFSANPITAKHINTRDEATLASKYGFKKKINYEVTKEYQHEEKISFPELNLKVIHAPGHTNGCAIILHNR